MEFKTFMSQRSDYLEKIPEMTNKRGTWYLLPYQFPKNLTKDDDTTLHNLCDLVSEESAGYAMGSFYTFHQNKTSKLLLIEIYKVLHKYV